MKKLWSHPRNLLSVALIALFLATPNPAKAASIFIDALNLNNLVAFNFGQFEGGFSINGSTPISTGGSIFGNGTQLNFTGQWIDLGAAVPFARTVYWEDPAVPNVIHDIFQWTVTPSGASGLATISGFFQSEGLGNLPPGVPPGDIITMKADGSHNPFNFSAAFLGGQVITDEAIPAPATLALFGLGLVGLGFSRRRKV